jgi:CubicO group peptidase (beta-lactamase class C family)
MHQRFPLYRWLLLACAAALLTTPGLLAAPAPTPETARGAEPTDPDAIAIDRRLTEAAAEGLDGVILVRHRDRVLLHRAYGWRDREAGQAMTVEVGFDVGSLVKPITAVGVLLLDQRGELAIERPLSGFFPEAPEDKASITVEQLLRHTSGLRDTFAGDYRVVSRDWLLEQAMGSELLGPPGEEERYSNTGYSLLAMIIEDTTGTAYEDWIREHVLAPAGAEGIGYRGGGWTPERLAVGTGRAGRRWGTPLDHAWAEDGPSWTLRGNGGMLATAEQMSAWYRGLIAGKILDGEALARFVEADGGESRAVGGRVFGHAGGNGIFNSLQISYLDHDLHMTFFTSSARHKAEDLWPEFREQVFAIARRDSGAGPSGGAR